MNHHALGPRLERRDFVSAWLTTGMLAAGVGALVWALFF